MPNHALHTSIYYLIVIFTRVAFDDNNFTQSLALCEYNQRVQW